ncbi:ligase-associated DNA damage response endonuclease PdeM [Achromobacter xylosoxidans]|uniref:ligase-associated DNA damage response endonuclease PdeM n=1 Tax=Alcaligenes xylosoxydans xylosoxydans TaxID=85698 RepID=UPI0001F41EFA|nr:ligase-associated DNA damage response endonuclease PdeM [Achromobacter xylosoxidans]AXA79697.1 phosphoesterase [Achromobacter xylosoxidans]EFV85695.1 metallophosphoesterase [Achromobacter xylosoxidans C54]NYS14672.1 ligase-associated DNA damage response endonuclease PdeM [Achromobacter xylosoxidans]QEQ25321.1 ligase-associated DNA damage response endonuclease PdeM [Achromobacter xylosoxidans]
MNASPDDELDIVLAGEAMVLSGARAMFWPARGRLIIADLHLGKSHVFRRAGIAVPGGATRGDLDRLAALVARTAARELWIVGDLLHGPAAQAAWRDAWLEWRRQHAGLDVAVLAGNHDRALDGGVLEVRQLGDACVDGPFLFSHIPRAGANGQHVIAGHMHPKTSVPGVPRSWPAFWLRAGLTVLPAFSDFTGGHIVDGGEGGLIVACVAGTPIPVAGRLR